MNIPIIFAGGSGTRMNTKSRPKQFLDLNGKPIIIYTIEIFDNHPDVDAIIVVCLEGWIPFLEKMLRKFEINKVVCIVPGGDSGQGSIYNGLCAAEDYAKKLGDENPNKYLTDVINFNYFFARKVMLTFSSKVFVFFPGGFGTLDEFSEIITLMKTEKMPQMPMFLVGKSFWKPFDSWIKSRMVKSFKTATIQERNIYKITDDINEIVKAANKVGHPKINDNIYNNFSKTKQGL